MQIKSQNLSFTYKTQEGQDVEALKDISLEFKQGEFVAVLGHNGSGKSTFAKHLNGILLPNGGTLYVDGFGLHDISSLVQNKNTDELLKKYAYLETKNNLAEQILYEIRRRIGMVFQNPDNQLVATIVEEDVAFAPENLGIPSLEIRKRVDEALKAVDMEEFALHAPHNLSGGQKQRIAIAGVLAMKPSCIVLDEPTAMLDPRGRKSVMDTISKLSREQNITVILITHHMNEAVLADRVVVLNRGLVFMDDKPENIFTEVEKLKSVGLFIPQTVEILYNLKKLGANIEIDAFDIETCADILQKYLEA